MGFRCKRIKNCTALYVKCISIVVATHPVKIFIRKRQRTRPEWLKNSSKNQTSCTCREIGSRCVGGWTTFTFVACQNFSDIDIAAHFFAVLLQINLFVWWTIYFRKTVDTALPWIHKNLTNFSCMLNTI